VPDEAHRALKLLSIMEGKAFGSVVLEAIDYYLKHKDAYNLSVSKKKENQQDSSKQ
jgi:predicted DNA-binding protein